MGARCCLLVSPLVSVSLKDKLGSEDGQGGRPKTQQGSQARFSNAGGRPEPAPVELFKRAARTELCDAEALTTPLSKGRDRRGARRKEHSDVPPPSLRPLFHYRPSRVSRPLPAAEEREQCALMPARSFGNGGGSSGVESQIHGALQVMQRNGHSPPTPQFNTFLTWIYGTKQESLHRRSEDLYCDSLDVGVSLRFPPFSKRQGRHRPEALAWRAHRYLRQSPKSETTPLRGARRSV
ncbi:hypothetical protein SKAU_G00405210 [Synaphobranchus kaupii]|uniref:Uncharacterized protein n=1 Tax=Synaphobranchus kaupii TaxID=118154 RepID=A0A9Q1E9Z5_SYNKA|nr:hypothetical protein SKAU_G00405210 [Synaphobranchus kaupii]